MTTLADLARAVVDEPAVRLLRLQAETDIPVTMLPATVREFVRAIDALADHLAHPEREWRAAQAEQRIETQRLAPANDARCGHRPAVSGGATCELAPGHAGVHRGPITLMSGVRSVCVWESDSSWPWINYP